MAKKKATPKTDAPSTMGVDVQAKPPATTFPKGPILRLVQMAGYLQYFFENGVNGSAHSEAEVQYLQDRFANQKKTALPSNGGE